MEPTLDESLSDLFENDTTSAGIQVSGKQLPLPKAAVDQARAELAQAQKAIDSLKSLLANSPQ